MSHMTVIKIALKNFMNILRAFDDTCVSDTVMCLLFPFILCVG